jgi:hypothetical protein
MEERLRARTSDLEAWNKTMLPTIRLTISEAQNQILTGHQDIRTFLPDKAVPVRNMNATLATVPRPQRSTPRTQTTSYLAERPSTATAT